MPVFNTVRQRGAKLVQAIESRIGKLWTHRLTGHVLLCIPFVAFLLLWLWPQPPSVAAVVLGGVAFLTFREMHHTHRALGMLAVFLLVAVELRDIYRERNANQMQQLEARQHADDRFAEILANNQQQFAATMLRFGIVQKKTEEVADLSKQNLENITGANSYAWVTPQIHNLLAVSNVPLAIHNYGPHVLTGVTIHVFDMSAFDSDDLVTKVFEQEYFGPNIEVGTLVAGQTRSLPYTIPPVKMNERGTHMYRLEITSQSGEVEELIQFRKDAKHSDMLAFFLVVSMRDQPLPTGKFTKPHLLELTGWSDEGFKDKKSPYLDSRKLSR